MKIFYGVQGTGNGHITRARVMAKELLEAGFEVVFQFTGRAADKYFDMEIFDGYQVRTGLTFSTQNGRVNYFKTARDAKAMTFLRDINRLNLSSYDLIICDYEPVTAWAAKRQRKKVLGIGHQYAFNYNIPQSGADPIAFQVMKYFAPADIGIGLHWHHFGQPLLPPIIETPELPTLVQKNKIVVYLPFEEQNEVIKYLSPFENYRFHLYSPQPVKSKHEFICCNPLSRDGFQRDLYDCVGIISNAGFELASEALQLGKKILAKPLHKQMEQISNALALRELGYGHTMDDMDISVIEHWLHDNRAVQVTYPNISKMLVDWIKDGMKPFDEDYIEAVWSQVDVLHKTY